MVGDNTRAACGIYKRARRLAHTQEILLHSCCCRTPLCGARARGLCVSLLLLPIRSRKAVHPSTDPSNKTATISGSNTGTAKAASASRGPTGPATSSFPKPEQSSSASGVPRMRTQLLALLLLPCAALGFVPPAMPAKGLAASSSRVRLSVEWVWFLGVGGFGVALTRPGLGAE